MLLHPAEHRGKPSPEAGGRSVTGDTRSEPGRRHGGCQMGSGVGAEGLGHTRLSYRVPEAGSGVSRWLAPGHPSPMQQAPPARAAVSWADPEASKRASAPHPH